MDPPGLAAGEELGTEQSAAAVYEALCRILFGSVQKTEPVPAEKPVASVNTWRIEQNHGAMIHEPFVSKKLTFSVFYSGQMWHWGIGKKMF